MSRCPDKTEWVLYAAGETAPERRDRLADHLEACDHCRRELAAIRRGLKAMDTLEAAPPLRPEALASLRRRLAAEASRSAPRSRPGRRLHPVRWAAAAAAVAAAVTLFFLAQPETSSPPDWPDSAQVDEEIAEITAELELLETDTFATAWEAAPARTPARHDTPNGQSRARTGERATLHG